MRKLILSFCVLAVAASLQAQTSYKKRPTLAVNFVLNDFKTASAVRASSFGTVLKDKDWSRIGQMNAGLGLQYLNGLSEHVDFNGNFQVSFVDFPLGSAGSQSGLLEADAGVNVKLLTDKYFMTPYLNAGFGASMIKSTFAAYMPIGLGLQFNLGNQEAFLFTNFQYRVPVTSAAAYHFNYSIGFAAPIGK
jgi:OOP family OmpA-OmpF porin